MVKSRDLSPLCDLSGETSAGPSFANSPRLAFFPLLLHQVLALEESCCAGKEEPGAASVMKPHRIGETRYWARSLSVIYY